MNDVAQTKTIDPIVDQVAGILRDMTSDWDLGSDEPIGRNTQLIADLAFESIDIVQLVVAIEENFGKRGIPFDKLLMTDGRYVEDLSVGQVADFLKAHL
jgi:acyl carrier protein